MTANSVTSSSSQDANNGGHVKVEGVLTGETKKVSFLVNKSADVAAESVDGLKAIAPAGELFFNITRSRIWPFVYINGHLGKVSRSQCN